MSRRDPNRAAWAYRGIAADCTLRGPARPSAAAAEAGKGIFCSYSSFLLSEKKSAQSVLFCFCNHYIWFSDHFQQQNGYSLDTVWLQFRNKTVTTVTKSVTFRFPIFFSRAAISNCVSRNNGGLLGVRYSYIFFLGYHDNGA